MRFGKARIEDGNIVFNRHMVIYTVPIIDILWAFLEKEGESEREKEETQEDVRLLVSNTLTIFTRRKKKVFPSDDGIRRRGMHKVYEGFKP